MVARLKQSTSVTEVFGPFVSQTDGVTPKTALTLTARLTKNGASFGNKSAGGIAHMENGYYSVVLDATDTNTIGKLRVTFTDAANFLPVWRDFEIVHANSYAVGVEGSIATTSDLRTEALGALSDNNLDHLMKVVVTNADVVDNTALAKLAGKGATASWSTFDNTTDSHEALRDRGDAAWITGGGASITDILNIVPLIPPVVDLANTATYRCGLMLTNAVDDLPTTTEITPGTIDIDRKAAGETSWTSVLAAQALLESAGLVYYDIAFATATYAEGDIIRFTFKGQKITVSANDYEISDATGRIFYTHIRYSSIPVKNLSAQAMTDVKAQVTAVMRTDACAELPQAQPPATPTIEQAIMFAYMAERNLSVTTPNEKQVRNDAGTVVCKASLADDQVSLTEGKYVAGP